MIVYGFDKNHKIQKVEISEKTKEQTQKHLEKSLGWTGIVFFNKRG